MGGRIAGKVALVTGAGSPGGLGQAIARRLAEEGARVILTDLDGDAAAERARDIGRGARAESHDATSEADWTRVIDGIMAMHGTLDILVNNAGIAILHPIEEMTLDRFRRQMDTNMTSAFLGMAAAVAAMRRAGRGGSIINISSVCGLIGLPRTHAYGAAKAGMRIFGKSLAVETAREGIRVNSVHPGMIRTRMTAAEAADDPEEQRRRLAAMIPMGDMGEPEDVANCVLFLASDEARYVTGSELVVDGGMTCP